MGVSLIAVFFFNKAKDQLAHEQNFDIICLVHRPSKLVPKIQDLTKYSLTENEAKAIIDLGLTGTFWTDKFFRVSKLSGSLKAAYESLKKARGNSNHNTQTQQVADADEIRDKAFRAFYLYVEAGTLRNNNAYRSASQAIIAHLAKIDRQLAYMGYSRQSTELALLFAEMEKVNGNLKTIGADAWLKELKDAENEFLVKQEGKMDEEVEKQVLLPVKETKEQTLLNLVALVQTLNGLELANIGGISDLNAKVDQVIAEVEVPARARQTRRSSDDEELEE